MKNDGKLKEGKLLVLIAGESASGKSSSLRNIRKSEGVFYLNTESGKPLPFPDIFKKLTGGLNNPNDIFPVFEKVENMEDVHTIVIDSLTFLLNMFETKNVLTATNTMKAWSDYQQFFNKLMQDVVANSKKNWIIIAHNLVEVKNNGEFRITVPVKGSLKNLGIEAYFSIVVYARRVTIKELTSLKYDPNLLHITAKDEALGYKHVFQCDVTKEFADSRIRAPIDCFNVDQIFMDNDTQILIDHLTKFYGFEPKN